MSASQGEEVSAEEAMLLEAIYAPFAQTALWPQFSSVSYQLWRQTEVHPRGLYEHAAYKGLVRPPLPRTANPEQQEETEVMVTLEGLALLSSAAEDAQRLLDAIRFIAEKAAAHLLLHPSSDAALIIGSEDVALALKRHAEDHEIRRLGPLIRLIDEIWSSYNESQDESWRLSIRPGAACAYAGVLSIQDLISTAFSTTATQACR